MVLIKRYRNGKSFNPQPPPKKEVAPSPTPAQSKPKKQVQRTTGKKIIKANRPSPRRKGGCGCGGRRR